MPELVKNSGAPTLLTAATEIGWIYLRLKKVGWLPHNTQAPFYMNVSVMLDSLYKMYGTDGERYRKYGRETYVTAQELYHRAHDAIIPELEKQTMSWANQTLNNEAKKLFILLKTIKQTAVGVELYQAAQRVWSHSKQVPQTDEEKIAEELLRAANLSTRPNQNAMKEALELKVKLKRKRLAAALRKELEESGDTRKITELLATLFAHPRGVAIMEAFDRSLTDGIKVSLSCVQEAYDAIIEFGTELIRNPNHIWRYEPLLMGGVKLMGMEEVPGFAEYVRALSKIKRKSVEQMVLFHVELALLCLGVVFSGPYGLVVIGTLELTASVYDTGLTYMEEREQELGAKASGFRSIDQQLASETNFEGTKLAGATALLTAIALFGATAALLKELKARAMERAAASGVSAERVGAGVDEAQAIPDPPKRALKQDMDLKVDSTGTGDPGIRSRGKENSAVNREETVSSSDRGIDVRPNEVTGAGIELPPDTGEPFDELITGPWTEDMWNPSKRKRRKLKQTRPDALEVSYAKPFNASTLMQSMEDQLNYVQLMPKLNPKKFRLPSYEFLEKGKTYGFGPRQYTLDMDKNLIEASTTRITVGIRDSSFTKIPGMEAGKDFGHLLGIRFGHIDAQLGPHGGFPQPSELNRFTGEWFRAEDKVFKAALRLQDTGQSFRVVAQAKGYKNGVPSHIRIFLESDRKIVSGTDSGWVAN
ncbi:hypothetical protein [Mesobacillus maritimus]|uniref:hypothetical protein n=1 Tax=Mesobacillus maritimus TaxID=1643336 RepID=UPI00384BE5F5